MNYQFKAFQLSFLLHSVIIASVIISGTFFAQYKKPIVLDFDVLKQIGRASCRERVSIDV